MKDFDMWLPMPKQLRGMIKSWVKTQEMVVLTGAAVDTAADKIRNESGGRGNWRRELKKCAASIFYGGVAISTRVQKITT